MKPETTQTQEDGAKADPTMTAPAGKPDGENVPPAGGESMAPADSTHPYAKPGAEPTGKRDRD